MGRPIDRIYEEFKEKKEEPGYSATEISNAISQNHRTVHADAIRRYILENRDLAVDLKRAGINLRGSNVQHLIRESRLAALMEGMSIGGTTEGLIERMTSQRIRSKGLKTRFINKRDRRDY